MKNLDVNRLDGCRMVLFLRDKCTLCTHGTLPAYVHIHRLHYIVTENVKKMQFSSFSL